MKKWIYVIGVLALGIVIFNNLNQTVDAVKSNNDLIIGLIIALIGSIMYGVVNIKH